jgi:hypothetical protein
MGRHGEVKWPPAMPSRVFEPGSVKFDKKVMEKVKSRLMLYQLGYAAKLQKEVTFHYNH